MSIVKKECSKCKKTLSVKCFRKSKHGKNGLHSQCNQCEREYRRKYYHSGGKEKRAVWRKKRAETHPELCDKQKRKAMLKAEYGLTLEQYDKMFVQQSGVCAICGGINLDGRRLFVDHNHQTGKVRGLLCMHCNIRLSVVEDEIFVEKARSYLGTKSQLGRTRIA